MLLPTILRCTPNCDYVLPTEALLTSINKNLHARLIIAPIYQLTIIIALFCAGMIHLMVIILGKYSKKKS